METKAIIQAIENNDSSLLMKALYSVALPPIIVYIKQKRGRKTDAEDCFQEAILTLIKKVKEKDYNEQFEVKNFLFVVARNIWFNKLKRINHLPMSDLEDVQVEDSSERGDQVLISDERSEAIQKLMATAGERCKKLLNLILFENKKMKEIVEIMEFSSVEVVKTNHYRCKKKMKEALKNDSHLLAALQ